MEFGYLDIFLTQLLRHITSSSKSRQMPPKDKAGKGTQKEIADKTFGMKNKNKSSKVNKYIQQLQATAAGNARRDVSGLTETNKMLIST